jgi:signal transduction histidine kinase
VESTVVGSREIAIRESEIELPPGADAVEIRYSAISLGAPERVRFRYFLEGLDKQWVEAGQRRAAIYANLPPGSYCFRVVAYARDGRWPSQETALRVRVRPQFHQTAFFRVTLAVVGMAIIFLSYRLRVSVLRRRFRLLLSERIRIGREIHDTLMQGVAGVTLLLEAAAQKILYCPEQAKAEVDRALQKLDRVMAEARCCILELRSPDPCTDLSSLARRLIQEMDPAFGMRVELNVEGRDCGQPAAVREQLARILREALANAIRHANASRATVWIRFGNGVVELTVEDDGMGFDPSALDGHQFGLMGMRERAEELGGSFELVTAPGEGTRIRVTIPCRAI